jgi:uncharacterized membrane protein
MTTATARDPRVEKYLATLDSALAGAPIDEKIDLLREIRAHILDAVEGGAEVDRVLAGLGAPRELVERYRMEGMLSRASQTFSPWILLRTAWRWAFTGIKGFIVFLFALVGYLGAFVLTLAVILRPFNHNIGLWVGPHTFEVGTASGPSVHEILGSAFTPVVTVTAFALAFGTTQLLRWIMQKSVTHK